MPKPVHIVFTTIFVPHVLRDLRENIARHGRLDQTKVWVVGDLKTPAEAATLAAEATAAGLETVYLDIPSQDAWGARHPELYSRIPYNNETRRNLGYLRALEEGCEVLISIDDDNFPTEDDFVGGHLKTGTPAPASLLSEAGGYHNVCEYLEFSPSRPIFPRGFPFELRGGTNQPTEVAAPAGARIGVTAGLWLAEPDVDATTWLNGRITGIAYKGPAQAVLARDTWTPVNTQNTSVTRGLIPAYLCVPMGFEVPGGKIQRYGDIWGGYFLQALLAGTNDHVAFGRPLVEHRRNPHSYLDDLRCEFWGLILTDWLLGLLKTDFKPGGASVCDRVEELSDFLRARAIPRLPAWAPPEVTRFLADTATTLTCWQQTCRRLL